MAAIEAIATTYLESDVSSVTFSSLGSYEHLQLRITTIGNAYNALKNGIFYLNGDTTDSNYHRHYMQGGGSTTTAAAATGSMWGLNSKADSTPIYGASVIDILDYRNTNKNTTVTSSFGSAATPNSYVEFVSCLWDNTAAITSIQLLSQSGPQSYNGFTRGSSFTLYGLNSS